MPGLASSPQQRGAIDDTPPTLGGCPKGHPPSRPRHGDGETAVAFRRTRAVPDDSARPLHVRREPLSLHVQTPKHG